MISKNISNLGHLVAANFSIPYAKTENEGMVNKPAKVW